MGVGMGRDEHLRAGQDCLSPPLVGQSCMLRYLLSARMVCVDLQRSNSMSDDDDPYWWENKQREEAAERAQKRAERYYKV